MSSPPMWAVLASIEFVSFAVFTGYLVRYYAAKGTPFYALAMVFVSWYLGFFGTLFLPIDIAEAYFSTYMNVTNVTEAYVSVLPNPSATASATPSLTPFYTASTTPSRSPAATWGAGLSSANVTATATATWNRSILPSSTVSASSTRSPNVTAAGPASASVTPSNTPSNSGTPSNTPSNSGTPSNTPSISRTPTGTPTRTVTPTPTVSPSRTGTPTPSPGSSSSRTPTPSTTPTRSHSGTPTRTPVGTRARSPSASTTPAPEGGGDCESGCGRLLDGGSSVWSVGARARRRASGSDDFAPRLTFVDALGGWASAVSSLVFDVTGSSSSSSSSPFSSPGGFDPSLPLIVPVVGPHAASSSSLRSSHGRSAAEIGPNGTGVVPTARPSPSNRTSPNSTSANTTVVTEWDLISTPVQLRNGPLEKLWMFVYWVTFLLTYIFIPLTQEYVAAGEFTKRGRLCASIKINMIFYAVMGLIAFGALAYVVIGLEQGLWDLMPVLISLANTMGLSIVILLLGYGTAEVPRAVWKQSNPEQVLRRLYFKAPQHDGNLFDARILLTDTLKTIGEFEAKVTAMGADKSYAGDAKNASSLAELQRCMGIVGRKVAIAQDLLSKGGGKKPPASSSKRPPVEQDKDGEEEDDSGGGGFFSRAFGGGNSKYKGVTVRRLATLHKRLMLQIAKLKKTQFRFDELVVQCIELEYVVARTVPPVPEKKKTAEGQTYYVVHRGAGLDSAVGTTGGAPGAKGAGAKGAVFDSKAMRAAAAAKGGKGGGAGVPEATDPDMDVLSEPAAMALMGMMFAPRLFGGVLNRLKWDFKMYAVPYAYKFVAVVAEVLSILLLWSEATIFLNLTGIAKENLSVFGWVLRWADELGSHSYVAIQLAAFFPLAYMCLCSTYAVFKMKLFDMMDLSGNQNTDPYSLLVCASLFNRLQFALAFNYLNVLMHSSDKSEYPNTAFLNSVGARMDLSIVDWYLPIVAVVVYLACKCNVFDRCLRKIGIEESGDPDRKNRDDDNLIREGILVVKKGRRTLGLGGGNADDEEERERQDTMARDRLKAVMARAQARREGRNPDEVAALDRELAAAGGMDGLDAEGGGGRVGAGGDYASGGSVMTTRFAMDSFAGGAASVNGGGGQAGAGTGGGSAPKGGLAALANRAGMGKLGAAFTQLGALAGMSGESESGGGAVVDHGDDEEDGAAGRGAMGDGGAIGRTTSGGFGGFSRHDKATADLMRARGMSGHISAVAAPIEPPTLAELLKGKRKM